MSHSIVILKKGKDAFVKRFHPWIFSGAIQAITGKPKEGEWVIVKDSYGNIIAQGHYQKGSITVRVLQFGEEERQADFWKNKFQAAFAKRQVAGLPNEQTNCYRLIHAEGDGLPGLIVDIYNDVAVVQCHSIGMRKEVKDICKGLLDVEGLNINSVYDKSKETLPFQYATNIENEYLHNPKEETSTDVLENGNAFRVDWGTGQKTGFFLDQRENRALLGKYAKGKSILNTFCYSGGFSIYGLKDEAAEVVSVDISQKAIDLTNENVELNPNFGGKHEALAEDVMQFLKEGEKQYDIVIVDPPAFAKSLNKKHNAVQGYKRLNAMAIKKVKPGGLLFTFSCSQVIDAVLFQNTIVAAALEAGRPSSILHRLSQPADHPVSLFHPEGNYLKGLVLHIA